MIAYLVYYTLFMPNELDNIKGHFTLPREDEPTETNLLRAIVRKELGFRKAAGLFINGCAIPVKGENNDFSKVYNQGDLGMLQSKLQVQSGTQ